MIIAGLGLGLAALLCWMVIRESRSRERAWERKEMAWTAERNVLLNRIMYLADRPWDMPEPVAESAPPESEYVPDALDEPLGLDIEYDDSLISPQAYRV